MLKYWKSCLHTHGALKSLPLNCWWIIFDGRCGDSYQTIWSFPLTNVKWHSVTWPYTMTTPYWSDFVPNSTFYRILSGFHGTFAMGVACRQGALTPSDTWSLPLSGLAFVLLVETSDIEYRLDIIPVCDIITRFNILLNLTYRQILVSIEHLQRVWHADMGRLLLRTPGPVPLGLAYIQLVETNPFPNWVAVVTPTDRPKSVRNRCLIELFCGVVCVVTLPFWHFCWCRGFCHRTESDLFLFLLSLFYRTMLFEYPSVLSRFCLFLSGIFFTFLLSYILLHFTFLHICIFLGAFFSFSFFEFVHCLHFYDILALIGCWSLVVIRRIIFFLTTKLLWLLGLLGARLKV